MQTKYTLLVLITLLAFDSFAQQADFEWSWATRGGGPRHIASNPGNPVSPGHSQKINDIAIDSQNNYYFLADVGSETSPGTSVTFGNVPNDTIMIPTYNDPAGAQFYNSRDTYIVSTTCEGEFRWQKTIGGGGDMHAFDIKTDAIDGVYIAGSTSISSTWQTPVHYDQDSVKGLPVGNNTPSPNNKSMYLIKYNTQGQYQWLIEPEGDNTVLPFQGSGGRSTSRGLFVEANGTIHWLVEIRPWHTYENGTIIPDSTYFYGRYIGDTGVLRYDKDGVFQDYTKLDINMIAQSNRFGAFTYNQTTNNYYLAAQQDNSIDGAAEINGQDVTGGFYLAAFDATNGNVAWWHQNNTQYGSIRDMVTDAQGNVYLTGECAPIDNNEFAGYVFTTTSGVGARPFVMKLDNTGQLVWGTNPDQATVLASESITLGDDEVFIGMGMAGQTTSTVNWDGVAYIRTTGHGADPVVIRFDRQTGSAIKIHDIMGAGMGDRDQIRSLAVDKLGNVVAGGFLLSLWLFDNHPVVPQLDKKATHPTDFFIAQLAKAGVSCDDLMSIEEVQKPQMRIYPNPAGNILHWQSDVGIRAISIYDISGRAVKEQAVTGHSGSLSLEDLSAGSYIVVLSDDTGKSMHKVLIKK
jgi:hypothetical protein